MTAVVEAEVVAVEVEVLPPDVETKVVALRHLDGPAQTTAVTVMLSHARTGLLAAIAAQDLPQIVEWKAKGAAVQEVAKQLRLGRDMALDAAEFVRRAERGIGVAIREGQARGEVGSRSRPKKTADCSLISPRDILTNAEMFGDGRGDKGNGVYAMTDGVSDAQFEEAITEARSEGNLSRTNVARKAKAKSSAAMDADAPQIAAAVEPDSEPAQPQLKKKRRLTKHDSTEMLANISGLLNGIVESLPFIDPAEVDAEANHIVIDNIRVSMGRIRRVLKEIERG